jgi:hypothetical protein
LSGFAPLVMCRPALTFFVWIGRHRGAGEGI